MRDIARHTFETWGIDQARRYSDGLLKCFHMIGESPLIGRPCDQIRSGYRRIEHGRHVVFYRLDRDGVLIGRILHQRVMPNTRVFEDS